MKKISIALFAAAAALIAASPVLAQPHDNRDNHGGPGGPGGYVHHNDWRKGGRIAPGDWSRGAPVDYRSHHLRRPPHGYEWRSVDGNYVLAAAATGLIAGLAIAGH